MLFCVNLRAVVRPMAVYRMKRSQSSEEPERPKRPLPLLPTTAAAATAPSTAVTALPGYSSILNIRHDFEKDDKQQTYNMFAIVNQIVKPAQELVSSAHFNFTAIVTLLDESVAHASEEFRLNLFVKQRQQLELLRPGSVVNVSNVRLEKYQGEVDGRIFGDSNLQVVGPIRDAAASATPPTSQCAGAQSRQRRIEELRAWWLQHCERIAAETVDVYTTRCKPLRGQPLCVARGLSKHDKDSAAEGSVQGAEEELPVMGLRHVLLEERESGFYRVRARAVPAPPAAVCAASRASEGLVCGVCRECQHLTPFPILIRDAIQDTTYYCPPCFRGTGRRFPVKLRYALWLEAEDQSRNPRQWHCRLASKLAATIFGCSAAEYVHCHGGGLREKLWQKLRGWVLAGGGPVDWQVQVRRSAEPCLVIITGSYPPPTLPVLF